MEESSRPRDLDEIDLLILDELQRNARISNAELGRRVSLSQPAIHNRIRRLERQGYVRQYVALLDRELLGHDLLCFIHIALKVHQSEQLETFRQAIRQIPEVLECHHITGEYDYLLKVVVRNRKALERLLIDRLTPIPGVARFQTSLVFHEVKAITALPLE
jgi:DNA-binding Lrp family transcriptional regulator